MKNITKSLLLLSILSLGTMAAMADTDTFTGTVITVYKPAEGTSDQTGSFAVRSWDNQTKTFILRKDSCVAVGQKVTVRYEEDATKYNEAHAITPVYNSKRENYPVFAYDIYYVIKP